METWADKRDRLFNRDNSRCQRCFRQTSILSLHHIKPRSQFGRDDDANLITLCVSCHDWVELNLQFEPLLKTREGIMNSLPSMNYKVVQNVMNIIQPGYPMEGDKIDIWVRWVEQGRKGINDLIEKYSRPPIIEEKITEISFKPSKGQITEEQYREMFK